jgi:hypothetical protein
MYSSLLADTRFHEQLLAFDRDLAANARAAGCPRCGGVLHSARYRRKPRGVPAGLGEDYDQRFSFCCASQTCRGRMTPASLRFLGRKVYLATLVLLVTALRHGLTDRRLKQRRLAGIDRRTLARWRTWWLTRFTASALWKMTAAALLPPVDPNRLPLSLLDRFAGDARQRLHALLRLLAPITGGAATMHAF